MILVFLSRHCRREREKPEAAEGDKILLVLVGRLLGRALIQVMENIQVASNKLVHNYTIRIISNVHIKDILNVDSIF